MMIEVRNVSKIYGKLEAVRDVSLTVKKGSIYGLIGSNGAGKTTLLKTLCGIYKENSGEIKIDSESVFENNNIKARMFFMPDNIYFFTQYSIKSMANFYKNIYPNWNAERFEKLRMVFNIDINKKIKSLSKGMQRQVAFHLALSTMPDYMILDEPMDGLDPVMRQKIRNLIIQDVADREMTVLISSHNLRELEDLCDHVGIMHKGDVLFEKDLDDLKSDIHKIQIAFKDKIPETLCEKVKVINKEDRGSISLLIVRGKKDEVISHFESFNPVVFDILPLTLEEIFIYEMGEVGYEIKNIML